MIDKQPHACTFEEGNTPAIFVFIGLAATRCKTGKAEHNVGWHIAIHAQ
jgi:hypothetical protein